MPGIAAFNAYGDQAIHSYFFKGDKYANIKWTPGKNDDSIAYGPMEFARAWKSLAAAKFTHVDAVLPIPNLNNEKTRRAHVFSGTQYAHIQYDTGDGDRLYGPPVEITHAWASLKEAGFNHVDAAMMVPGKTDEAWFFSGKQYCRIQFRERQNNDKLLEAPKPITAYWAVTGFMVETIDAIIPNPATSDQACIFSGDHVGQIKIVPNGDNKLIGEARRIAPSPWNSLVQAGFF